VTRGRTVRECLKVVHAEYQQEVAELAVLLRARMDLVRGAGQQGEIGLGAGG